MPPHIVRDSDDDLDALSLTKPVNSTPLAQTPAPGPSNLELQSHVAKLEHEPAQAPQSSRSQPTSPVDLVGVTDPLGLLDSADSSLLTSAAIGVKRKQTTMELMESRKRAKSSTARVSDGDTGREERRDQRRSVSAGSTNHELGGALERAPVSCETNHVIDEGTIQDYTDAQTSGIKEQGTETAPAATPKVPAAASIGHSASKSGPHNAASQAYGRHRERSTTVEYASARPSRRSQSASLGPDCVSQNVEPSLPDLNASSTKPRTKKSRHEIPSSSDPGPDMPPKEVYKPRPSRSRATGVADELFQSIDFSKRPEKAAKSRKKNQKETKRKATPETQIEDKVHRDDAIGKKVEQEAAEVAGDGVGSGGETAMATVKSATNAEQEPAPTPADPVPVAEDAPRRKRGRPKKQERPDEPDPPAPEPKKRGRKSRAAKAAERDDNCADAAGSESDAPVTSRRKKTRSSNQVADSASEESDEDDQVVEAPVTDLAARVPLSPSKSVNLKAPWKARAQKDLGTAVDGLENADHMVLAQNLDPAAAPVTPRKETTAAVGTPTDKTKVATGKGPSKHSPLSGSKVKYRVGLSRHARIEPLLRVVKK